LTAELWIEDCLLNQGLHGFGGGFLETITQRSATYSPSASHTTDGVCPNFLRFIQEGTGERACYATGSDSIQG
jgi:hypothetical protein